MYNEELADRIVEFLCTSFPKDSDFDTLKRELMPADDSDLLTALDALEKQGQVHGGFIRTGIDQCLQGVYSVGLTTAGRDLARAQGMTDIVKLEELGNREFDKTRRRLYEEATGSEAANLRERFANAGMARSSSYARAATDLVFAQFQKLKAAFLESYLLTLTNTLLGITPARCRWLTRKLEEVWTKEVDRAKSNALLLASATGMSERDTTPYVDALVTRCLDLKLDATNEIEIAALRQESGLSKMSSEVYMDDSSPTTNIDPDSAKRVFVIHGRDERLRKGVFEFLRSIGLEPLEWPQLLSRQESASPFIGTIVEEAFKNVQAVVALITPDERVALRPDLTTSGQNEAGFQPRPNVLFETGMAFSTHPDRTVLVQIGQVRPFSDIGGRYIIQLDGSSPKRQQFADRLRAARCAVDLSGTDWHTAGDLTPPSLEPEPLNNQKPEAVSPSNAPQIDERTLPEVFLHWEVQEEGKKFPGMGLEELLVIENTSDVDAYDVRVNDVSLNSTNSVAAFAPIPRLPAHSRQPLTPAMIGARVPEHLATDFKQVF